MKLRNKDAFEKRIHEIDLFRGFLILLVIFDHLLWFFRFYIFKTDPFLNWYWTSTLRNVVRQIVLMMFLFTCGISCHLSRNNKKRGAILFALSVGVVVATHLIQLLPMFSNRVVIIDFNILGVIALSILLFCVFEKQNSQNLWLISGILMIFYFFTIVSTRLFNDNVYYPFRSVLYNPFNPVPPGYVGDYLPLFPYVIFLFLGVIFARKYYPNKTSLVRRGSWEKPICFLGRHTLLIYIAHEVLFTLIFMGIGALLWYEYLS